MARVSLQADPSPAEPEMRLQPWPTRYLQPHKGAREGMPKPPTHGNREIRNGEF